MLTPARFNAHVAGILFTKHKAGPYVGLNSTMYKPDKDEDLQVRICTAVHCEHGGHPEIIATTNLIKQNVFWSTMQSEINSYVQGCMFCICSSKGLRVPLPLCQHIHATKVPDLLHFDYFYIGESRSHDEYIIILKQGGGFVSSMRCAMTKKKSKYKICFSSLSMKHFPAACF